MKNQNVALFEELGFVMFISNQPKIKKENMIDRIKRKTSKPNLSIWRAVDLIRNRRFSKQNQNVAAMGGSIYKP